MVSTRQLGMAKSKDYREGIGFFQKILAKCQPDEIRRRLSPGLKTQSQLGVSQNIKYNEHTRYRHLLPIPVVPMRMPVLCLWHR